MRDDVIGHEVPRGELEALRLRPGDDRVARRIGTLAACTRVRYREDS